MMKEVISCPICDNKNLQPTFQAKDHTVTDEVFEILRCCNCELLLTSPRPSVNEIERYYLSDKYISHSSKAKNLTDKLYLIARKFTLKKKLSLISKYSPVGKLLDFGCGTGDFIKLAAKKRWEVYGVEPSSSVKVNSDLKIVRSLAEIGAYEFNSITLWHVLEHIPDIDEILQQLRDRLNKNGTIFIAVPNYKCLDATHYKEYWAAYDVPRHIWHFNQKSMTRLLEKNGLKLIKTKPMLLDSIYVSQLSEKYLANNKSTLDGFVKGSLIGLRSNLAAIKSKEYSSLIYVIKK